MIESEWMALSMAVITVGGGIGIGMIAVAGGLKTERQRKLLEAENRTKERLLLIEKGLDPAIADLKPPGKYVESAMLWGLMLGGAGLGLLLSPLAILITGVHEKAIAFGMVLLFGGAGLVSYVLYKGKVRRHTPSA